MGSYSYVPLIALFCYIFLMMIFLAAKKNRLINCFLALMTTMIGWTGGSLLMRFEVWPSYEFWYHVSLIGIIILPYLYFIFVNELAERSPGAYSRIYAILLGGILLINIFTGYFLAPPTIQEIDGKTLFVYSTDWHVVWFFLICGIVVLHTLIVIFQKRRSSRSFRKQFEPILLGILLLFIGHLILMVPIFNGFPVDIVCGILNAFLLFYALVRRRLFQLKMLASQKVCFRVGFLLALVLFYNLSPFFARFLTKNFQGLQKFYPLLFAMFFAVITSALTFIWQTMVRNVFVKDELQQADTLKMFSERISQSLRLAEILDLIVRVIKETTSVQNVYICLLDEDGSAYRTVYSDQPLTELSFVIKKDNPIVNRLSGSQESVMLQEFQHTVEYKSMWEIEKQQFSDMGIECSVGISNNDGLMGLLLLCSKNTKKRLSYDDQKLIESICSIGSIAIKNAKLYEKAYTEARTDELTGLLNRKCFYEILDQEYELSREQSLALVIINVDDFKLYNQLYGTEQGDTALQNIAHIIDASVGENGMVARYSGKEFAILLPGYDVFTARTLTESIRKQIYEMNLGSKDYKMKQLTISAGISAAPYGASSAAELITNADMAVYHVKHKGKNGIQVFDVKIQDGTELRKSHTNVQAYHDYETTIYALTAAIDTKDHYTFSHSNNVAYYATELAKATGLNNDMVEIIRQAGLLHDIGKIGIPEEILNKQKKLIEDEYEILKGHVEASIGIIRHLPSLDYVIPAVIAHHERYDGNGYPRRIKGENIPLSARILCIADAFDAMISKRCYKPSMPVECALQIIADEAGKQFDPALSLLFVDCIHKGDIHPVCNETEKLN